MAKPVIAITMGDPGGIGPEVTIKALQGKRDFNSYRYILIGSTQALELLKENLKIELSTNVISTLEEKYFCEGKVNFFDITNIAKNRININSNKACIEIGENSSLNASVAFSSIEKAAGLAKKGSVDAIVTGPIHKEALREIDKNFVGHTEYFSKFSEINSFAMMFVGSFFKVTLVTIHVSLSKVSQILTEELVFEKIRLTHSFLKKFWKIQNPNIAIYTLNPHGKESGLEEESIIVPAICQAKEKGIFANGPYPADQIFYEAYKGKYDAIISMYHDQALGPFKMVSFHEGVNVTLGLPYIRTSPDHGTAFDIAYKGHANPSSMTHALELSEKLVSLSHVKSN